MPRAYYSNVLDHPVDRVWSTIRDFNDYPRYIDGVTDSLIEDDKPGDEVGAVRRFCYLGAWIRQRLSAHSDAERTFSYAGLEPLEFPAHGPGRPGAAAYAGTVRLAPVTDGDRTFVEWFVDISCAETDAERWHAIFTEWIPEWVESLDRTLERDDSNPDQTGRARRWHPGAVAE